MAHTLWSSSSKYSMSCRKIARKLSFWILAVSSDAVMPKNVFCVPPAMDAMIAMMKSLWRAQHGHCRARGAHSPESVAVAVVTPLVRVGLGECVDGLAEDDTEAGVDRAVDCELGSAHALQRPRSCTY